ncbi:MAG: helix-turn-helix domain-containing protein [Microcoleaceae cyanobacterium]
MKFKEAPDFSNFSLPNPPIISSHQANWDELQLVFSRQPAWYIPDHVAVHHTICVNTGNSITLERTVDGRSQTIDAIPIGDIGFYPANSHQTFQAHQESEAIQLYLQPSLLHRTEAELCLKDGIALIPKLTPGVDPLIQYIAIALKTSLEMDGTASRLYADAMANALAVHLLVHYSTYRSPVSKPSGRLSEPQIKQVIDYIHDHVERDIKLAELANLAQLSSYHFTRLFKQSIGLAPHQYHIRCRIDRAKQLLLDRKMPLSEIAISVGFSSQAHLNYHFKRCVGTTPMTFLHEK